MFPNSIKLQRKSSYRIDSSCPRFSTSAHSKLSMHCGRHYSLVSLQLRQTMHECCVSGPKWLLVQSLSLSSETFSSCRNVNHGIDSKSGPPNSTVPSSPFGSAETPPSS